MSVGEIDEKPFEVQSIKGYMGKMYICTSCLGEAEITDSFCRWCGAEFNRGKDQDD